MATGYGSCQAESAALNSHDSVMLDLSDLLGWVSAPEPGLCQGYYRSPVLGLKSIERQVVTSADRAQHSHFEPGQAKSVLKGNVQIDQADKRLVADHIDLYRDKKTGQLMTADLYGNIRLYGQQEVIAGNKAHFNFPEHTWQIHDSTYRIARDKKHSVVGNEVHWQGLNGWGQSPLIQRDKQGIVQLDNASYTTCPPDMASWHITAHRIHLNQQTGRGDAHQAVLWLSKVPVFYLPYFNFPIDKRRKTGFLYPTLGSSSKQGLTLAWPFYWNLAPNYDITITPQLMAKRGLNTAAEFRYLTNNSHGEITGAYLPNDKAFRNFRDSASTAARYGSQANFRRLQRDSEDRSYFSFQQDSSLDANWTTHIDYNYVSDDYYFQDFSLVPEKVSTNQLIREASTQYQSRHWNFLARMQGFQTLHPVNQTEIEEPYKRLPQLALTAKYPFFLPYSSFWMSTELVNFASSRAPQDAIAPVDGKRYDFYPRVAFPMIKPYGYLIPELALNITAYDLNRAQQNGYPNNHESRSLPIFSVDSGLYFDRDTHLWGHDYVQTLEPRLFYLFVPYENQKNIPVFDSGLKTFDYEQLFTTNRFSGTDRVGDANQLTLALSTHWLDQTTGRQKLNAQIGEIFYFHDRRVTLCRTEGCIHEENPFAKDSLSPLVSDLTVALAKNWDLHGGLAWDFNNNEADNGHLRLHYQPQPKRIINVGYNYLRNGDILRTNADGQPTGAGINNLNQYYLNFAWPLFKRWHSVGAYTYNVSHGYIQTWFFGLQYDSCCWSLRAVYGRYFTSLNEDEDPNFDDAIYLQFQLKGVGSVGTSDPSNLLETTIQGYQDPFTNYL